MLRAIAADHIVPVLSLGELKNSDFPCHFQIWPVLTQVTVSIGMEMSAFQRTVGD